MESWQKLPYMYCFNFYQHGLEFPNLHILKKSIFQNHIIMLKKKVFFYYNDVLANISKRDMTSDNNVLASLPDTNIPNDVTVTKYRYIIYHTLLYWQRLEGLLPKCRYTISRSSCWPYYDKNIYQLCSYSRSHQFTQNFFCTFWIIKESGKHKIWNVL